MRNSIFYLAICSIIILIPITSQSEEGNEQFCANLKSIVNDAGSGFKDYRGEKLKDDEDEESIIIHWTGNRVFGPLDDCEVRRNVWKYDNTIEIYYICRLGPTNWTKYENEARSAYNSTLSNVKKCLESLDSQWRSNSLKRETKGRIKEKTYFQDINSDVSIKAYLTKRKKSGITKPWTTALVIEPDIKQLSK